MFKNWLLASFLITVLSACGFQLRGFNAGQESASISITVGGVQAGHPVIQAVNRLRYLGDDSSVEKKHDVQLIILNERWKKSVISVNQLGQAQEYELRYTVLYELFDFEKKRLRQASEMTVVRNFLNDVNNALAISREEEKLKLDMTNEFVERFLRLMPVITGTPST